ncbi:hypothetical protein MNBD_NITROSPINAE02-1298 [hydrothermal vent metagenome]|uniref:Cytochrome c domain-containing protein n=1 Tax=hydrothermal vent metagenome TaxID=652676 RepID=A0A3B1BNJ3_9ZZZZ
MRKTNILTVRWLSSGIMILALLIFLAPLAGAAKDPDPNIGRQLYQSYCLVCHGPNGDTKGPLAIKLKLKPANLASDKYQKKNISEMTAIIGGYERVADEKMPIWRRALPESNIEHIAAYIAEIKSTDLRFIGNTRRGRLIFRNSCVACHGSRGKGTGILAKLIGAPMKDFRSDESIKRRSDKALISIIRKGKDKFMPGWEGTLNSKEIIDVAAYVRSLSR